MDGISQVNHLIRKSVGGDRIALDRLFDLVYAELRAISRRQLRAAAPFRRSIDSGALVHELYIKLLGGTELAPKNRGHFFAVAAKAIRHILIDHIRRRTRAKRGGNDARELLLESRHGKEVDTVELLALDEALARLEGVSPRLAQVVQLRFFAGSSVEETAELLDVDPRTVKRDWRKARAFLRRELDGPGDVGS
jgi:RNA polymerase sigma factor (TIGR02999 family)